MTDLVATTPGLFPLPEWAKDELADLKGHQKSDLIDGSEGEEVRRAYDRGREEAIGDQREAGLDRIVEGQLRWDDMLAHPLAVHPNVDRGGIVRYYDNNNFYRAMRVDGPLDPTGDVAAELDATSASVAAGDLQAVLPGPYTLFDLATDRYYGDEADFLAAVAEFLAGEAAQFPEHATLFLPDPSLVVRPPDDDLADRVPEAIDEVAGAVDADVVVHTYWGALGEKTYAHLMDADVEALGVDLVAADREATLYNLTEYGTTDAVALGVVDGQNTRVEDPETVAERVDWVRDRVTATFDRTYVTSNTELFYLPTGTCRAKLSTLAAGAAVGRGEDPDAAADEGGVEA